MPRVRREAAWARDINWAPAPVGWPDNEQGACQKLRAYLRASQWTRRGGDCKKWIGRALRSCKQKKFVSMLEAYGNSIRSCARKVR
jgi:hypothetical protein